MEKQTRKKTQNDSSLPEATALEEKKLWPLFHPTAQELLDILALPFFILDENSRFIYLNQAAKEAFKRFGIKEDNIIGKDVKNIFPGGVGSSFYEHHQKAIMTGETAVFENFFPALQVWLEVHTYPSLDGICVSFWDITEQKRLSEAFCESEMRFRSLAESALDGILSIDAEGKILFANQAIKQIFGYELEELLDKSITVLMPESYQNRFQNVFKQYVYSGIKHISWNRVEFPGKHKNGKIVPLELSYSEAVQNGQSIFTSILRDISDRKRVEELLRKSEANFRALFFQNPTPMWVWDFETLRFLEVNEAATEFYGYSRQEFLSMTVNDIRPSDEEIERFMSILEKVKQQQTTTRYGVWKHRLKNGKIVSVEIMAHVMEFQGKQAVLSVIQDLSRQEEEKKILQDTLSMYRLFFEANPEAMIVFDTKTLQFLAVNEAALKLYGYTREEFLSLKLTDIRPPEEIPKLKEFIKKCPKKCEPHKVEHMGVWLHKRKDGTTFYAEILSEFVELFGKQARISLIRKVESTSPVSASSKNFA
jgi:PAS domain S-box-containing protein